MGPLMKKFNFRLKAQMREAQMPERSKEKANGHSEHLDENAESEVEDDDRADTTADVDDLSEKSVSVMSEGEVPHSIGPRRKSFFSVRRKQKPSLGSDAHLGPKATKSLLFKRKAKEPKATEPPAFSSFPRSAHQPNLSKPNRVSFEDFWQASGSLRGQGDWESTGQGSDRLLAFERGTFSLIEELNGLGEGGIPDLREQLSSDNKECSEKIKRLLHQHYRAFISASKGIRAMDGEMQALRAFLNKEHSLLNSLKEIADPQGRFADKSREATSLDDVFIESWDDSKEGGKWHNSLQELDIVIAERRPAEALPLLKRTEKTLLPGQKSGLISLQAKSDVMTVKQAKVLADRRQRLCEFTTSQIAGSRIGSKEMQVAVQVLASLSGRADALKKQLEAHSSQLRKNIDRLLKQQNSGADADGTDFSNALGQQVFGTIAAASEDVQLIFGKDLKDLASLFLVWALTETERCSLLLKRHALSPFAAPAGLGPTMACCLLAYIHCTAIQASHSIRLAPRLMRDLWPACDQVMQRRVKRVVEDVKSAVVAEIEMLVCHGLPSETSAGAWSDLMQILPSADLLLDEMEAIVQILLPMAGPRVREALSFAFSQVFREYTNAIASQFTHYRYADSTLPKVLDDTIEMALEVCHSMVEQFLPEICEPLRPKCGKLLNLKTLHELLVTFQDKLLPPQDREDLMSTRATSFGDGRILDTNMTDASWRSGRPRTSLFQLNSGGSGYSRQNREERQASIRSSGRSLDASTLRSFEINRSKFAEDDRMQSLQRRNRRSMHEIMRSSRDSTRESADYLRERPVRSRMGSMMSTMQHMPDDHSEFASHHDNQEDRHSLHGLSEHDHEDSDSTFGGLHRSSSSDSLSSTAEVVMELQPGGRLSSEDLGHSSSRTEPAARQAPGSRSSGHKTGKDVSQESSRSSSHDQGQPNPLTANGHTKASDSEEEDMMARLTRHPVTSPLVRQISPAAWPMPERGPVSLDNSESDSGGEEGSDSEDPRVQGPSRHAEPRGTDSDEDDEEADEDFIMSQLTKGVKKTPIPNIQEEGSSDLDLEEMNEDLSDFDEDDMMAALTKRNG